MREKMGVKINGRAQLHELDQVTGPTCSITRNATTLRRRIHPLRLNLYCLPLARQPTLTLDTPYNQALVNRTLELKTHI